ncbi:MAG: hypothetical protein AMXMBFR76_16460 [Pseudomonadota bacterium]
MRRLIFGMALCMLAASAFAWDDRYEINTDPYGSSIGGSTDIEMRKKYDYDPSSKYRGEIDSDGSIRMKNMNGDILRGTIDSDGYGRLRDQDGNTYRVRPR